ncbi:PQQ-binding-like beta-propeller repeat protein [Planctomicrobium sp. SH668]|uniref:outer membrane protein assembly factor BamB family protein n=1 Tax=Planctomicrobium sp. SH668 TaxID=3448126 RepID=UPI003F5BDABA
MLSLFVFALLIAFPETQIPAAGSEPTDFQLVAQLWSIPIAGNDSHQETRSESQLAPEIFPALWNDVVIVSDAAGVRALNLQTGKSAWPVDEHDEGYLLQTSKRSGSSRAEPAEPSYRGFIHEDYWYGIVDRRLVCLNLAAEGRLEWSLSPRDLVPITTRNAWFSGDPILGGGTIFVPIRQLDVTPQSTIYRFTLKGEETWRSTPFALKSHQIAMKYDALAATDSHLLLYLGNDELVAFDIPTKKLQWSTRVTSTSTQPRQIAPNRILSTNEKFVVCADGNSGIAFNLEDGQKLWELRFATPVVRFCEESNGTFLCSGEQLTAFDAHTLAERWRFGGVDLATSGFGRGVVRTPLLIWPTRDEIWVSDLQTGRVQRRIPLQQMTGEGGGNLLLTQNTVLIANRTSLRAFRIEFSPKSLP